jgi:hypothetical protein
MSIVLIADGYDQYAIPFRLEPGLIHISFLSGLEFSCLCFFNENRYKNYIG